MAGKEAQGGQGGVNSRTGRQKTRGGGGRYFMDRLGLWQKKKLAGDPDGDATKLPGSGSCLTRADNWTGLVVGILAGKTGMSHSADIWEDERGKSWGKARRSRRDN